MTLPCATGVLRSIAIVMKRSGCSDCGLLPCADTDPANNIVSPTAANVPNAFVLKALVIGNLPCGRISSQLWSRNFRPSRRSLQDTFGPAKQVHEGMAARTRTRPVRNGCERNCTLAARLNFKQAGATTQMRTSRWGLRPSVMPGSSFRGPSHVPGRSSIRFSEVVEHLKDVHVPSLIKVSTSATPASHAHFCIALAAPRVDFNG
jgi:hypothetical protein